MKHISRMIAAVLTVIIVSSSFFAAACAPGNEAVLANTPETSSVTTPFVSSTSAPAKTPTPLPTLSPSPVPPEKLTYKQKSDMLCMTSYSDFYFNPSRIYIFYLENNGQSRLVWVKKESYPPANGFDLLDVFNDEVLFHVSIESNDQGKVTPSEFPNYIDSMNESLRQYDIVAAGKLLDINDIYTNSKVDFYGTGNPYDVLFPHLKKTPNGFIEWSKKEMLDAFIDVTPAQYILPIWEYVPNAVTPYSYFNPPSPTPVLTPTPAPTPIPDSYKDQTLPLLGIDQDFREFYSLGSITVYYYLLNGSKRIIWAIRYYGTPQGTKDVHSLFNDEYLFSEFVDPESGPAYIYLTDCWKYYSASSPMLEGIQLLGSGSIADTIYNYECWGIVYNGNELVDKLRYDSRYDPDSFYADLDLVLTKDEVIDLYLRLTPLENIPPFWEYVPNAVTPDGFLTPSPVISPTAAP